MTTFRKARDLVAGALQLSFRPDKELTPADVQAARQYIAEYWPKVERFHPKDDESLLGLPKPYLVPSYRAKTGFGIDFDDQRFTLSDGWRDRTRYGRSGGIAIGRDRFDFNHPRFERYAAERRGD